MVPWCTALVWPGMDRSWLCLSLFSSFSCVVLPWSAAPEWSGRVWDVWLVPISLGRPSVARTSGDVGCLRELL